MYPPSSSKLHDTARLVNSSAEQLAEVEGQQSNCEVSQLQDGGVNSELADAASAHHTVTVQLLPLPTFHGVTLPANCK